MFLDFVYGVSLFAGYTVAGVILAVALIGAGNIAFEFIADMQERFSLR